MKLDQSQYETLLPWVPHNARVLDLGCGDGRLLTLLKENKQTKGLGVEIDHDNITRCIANSVSVIEADIDKNLCRFEDNSFDLVLMTQTLQAVKRPDITLKEMLRIGRECIVTFPNFGHWRPRLHLLCKGKMPVSDYLPYSWYDTPNIHFCTVNDFQALCRELGITILNKQFLGAKPYNRLENTLASLAPNMFAETAIFHLRSRS